MHLDSAFLDWYAEPEGGSIVEVNALFRGYEIWRHARDRTSLDATDLDRIDVISSLRRAVNHRLKALRATYNFDHLPSALGKKQVLERLHEFGIVRSSLIKDLLDVRNLIEHEDSDPPDLDRCRHYVDITWYFLKSTDKLVDIRTDYVRFLHEDGKQNIGVSVDQADDWKMEIRAEISRTLLLDASTPDSIPLADFVQKPIRGKKGLVLATGTARVKGAQLLSLARSYFAAAGYWHDDADA